VVSRVKFEQRITDAQLVDEIDILFVAAKHRWPSSAQLLGPSRNDRCLKCGHTYQFRTPICPETLIPK
jgi:hypothetical protein